MALGPSELPKAKTAWAYLETKYVSRVTVITLTCEQATAAPQRRCHLHHPSPPLLVYNERALLFRHVRSLIVHDHLFYGSKQDPIPTDTGFVYPTDTREFR
jgi:hypothetical protein